MGGTVLYGPRDIRFEERAAPTIISPSGVAATRRPKLLGGKGHGLA